MTDLEIILIAILWVVYGVFSGWRWSTISSGIDIEDTIGAYVISIIFSPIVLLIRAIKGIIWYEN